MEQTAYKGIPYPSEYEDPFFSSFEDMMEFFDINADMRYTPVSGFLSLSTDRFEFTPSEEIDHVGGVGYPIRYRELAYDPWKYGIIRSWNASSGICYIDGAALVPGDTQVEIGSPSMVSRIRLFFSGNYNSVATPGQDGLMWNQHGEGFRWNGPAAYLVKMDAVHKTANGGSPEYVNAQKNNADYAAPNWLDVFTTNIGQGVSVQVTDFSSSDFVDVSTYEFNSGDIVDVHPRGIAPNSAQDLSVELTFVYKGDQDQYCAGNSPTTVLTISGMSPGESWQGLTDGAHQLCPSSYTAYSNYVSASSFSYSETWLNSTKTSPYSPDFLSLVARYQFTTGGTYSSSLAVMSFFNGVTTDASSVSETSLIYGYIRDRLFTTFVLNGVTFSLSRGPGPWGL